jgi:hypothetical protein
MDRGVSRGQHEASLSVLWQMKNTVVIQINLGIMMKQCIISWNLKGSNDGV